MKRLFLSLFAFVLLVGSASAQEDVMKAFKAAKKAYGSYTLDQENKADMLSTAREKIDIAIKGIDGVEDKERAKIWSVMGNVYNSLAAKDLAEKTVNAAYKPEGNFALKSFEGFNNALKTAQKKWETKGALEGLLEAATHLSNMGANQYEDKDYSGAFESFNAVLNAHDVLSKNDMKTTLESETAVNDMRYAAGLSAYSAERLTDAQPIFEKLMDAKYDKASVYEVLYKCNLANDEAKAISMLEAGRKLFPNDVGLLFAEINHYLKAGKLDVLTGKLKLAIEKEPNNVTLYNTLGNVYDNLCQTEMEAGNNAKSQEYFDLAMDQYSQALEKDDKNFDAIYSLGALYYNKAASVSKELVALESDYSKEGMRKYEAKKAEVFAEFDKSLPYFQKAEALDPNDKNTLIALGEIFAKKDDIEKAKEFKTRLDNVAAGKTNKPYFKN